jgi:hypothetical protein
VISISGPDFVITTALSAALVIMSALLYRPIPNPDVADAD